MHTREDELEAFKREIDLRDYAAAQGFVEDRRASSIHDAGMRHRDTDEKILIGMGHDDHWVYYSVRPLGSQGSIIDFIQKRQGVNLGQVRRELRPWLAGHVSVPPPPPGRPARLKAIAVDLSAVREAYDAAQGLLGHHRYLCDARAIPASLLASERFAGRMRIGAEYGNVLFPHWNKDKQICGFEKKNSGFTGFSSHGTKGLWCSAAQDNDRRMVIAETTIDALSYAALFGYEDARFFSIAGQMNPHQPALLNLAMQKTPEGSRIILAVDHDSGGDMLADFIEPIFRHVRDMLGRTDLELVVHHPEIHGQDWNDVLRGRGDPNPPTATPQPL